VEENRKTNDTALSFGMLETYHTAYRLLAQLRERDTEDSLALADFAKARVLKDRIDESSMRLTPDIPVQKLIRIEELSSRFIAGNASADEQLEKLEKETVETGPEGTVAGLMLAGKLKGIKFPPGVIVISYLFTPEGQLRAYVVSNESPVQIVKLPISEGEVESFARATTRKIKDLVFFKKDGKELYDRLLAPLQIDAEHLIIVPDKSLWRIPFHALSPDGSSYLIEKKLVSYAPSVVTLLDSIKKPRPERKTIRVFANNLYRDRFLLYADSEAEDVARIFGSKPFLNSTASEFLSNSDEADILHFSMHAQAEAEEPLNSFLGFRRTGNHDGRATVENLLKVRLKPKSLVFLASCDTSNVLNGEGIVSIAWAMLGSGSTSVISAQWEANDRSTKVFSELFYKQYRTGQNAAKALQAASTAMIRNKSGSYHEPYYWAAFTLLGDFR
jgi:CHAT domain-containing protein